MKIKHMTSELAQNRKAVKSSGTELASMQAEYDQLQKQASTLEVCNTSFFHVSCHIERIHGT